jgi:hypothetical protein
MNYKVYKIKDANISEVLVDIEDYAGQEIAYLNGDCYSYILPKSNWRWTYEEAVDVAHNQRAEIVNKLSEQMKEIQNRIAGLNGVPKLKGQVKKYELPDGRSEQDGLREKNKTIKKLSDLYALVRKNRAELGVGGRF